MFVARRAVALRVIIAAAAANVTVACARCRCQAVLHTQQQRPSSSSSVDACATPPHHTTTLPRPRRRRYRRQQQQQQHKNDDKAPATLLRRLRGYVTSEVAVLAALLMLLSALWEELHARGGALRQRLKDMCTTTLEVRSSHEQYAMIMDWMARQPRMHALRNLALRPVTLVDEEAALAAVGGSSSSDYDDAVDESDDGQRALLVPGYGSHLFRFGATWLYITRSEDTSKQSSSSRGGGGGGAHHHHLLDRENDVLTITLLTRRRAVLRRWLASVRASWQAHVQCSVRVYCSDGYGARWRLLTERARRPLSTLQLPRRTLDVVREVRAFLRLRATYAALGVPWRRGYLFEGSPGTGKTSFALALASTLRLPVYLLSLRAAGVDDEALLSLIAAVPPRALLLIEDLENALRPHHRDDDADGDNNGDNKSGGVSLSALLNALDGVASSEGRVLVVTTNNVARLPAPAALLRPGRIDRCVHFAPLQPDEVAAMRASFAARLRTHVSPTTAADDAASMSTSTSWPRDADAWLRQATATATMSPAACQQTLLDAVYAMAMHGDRDDDDDAATT